jgi:hypothetical protein
VMFYVLLGVLAIIFVSGGYLIRQKLRERKA